MKITEKEIKETELKTYVYLSTLLSGFFGAGALLKIGSFNYDLSEYLTYHNNPEDYGQKGHYVNLTEMRTDVIIGIIFIVLFIMVIAYRVRKIKKLEKKIPVYVFSVFMELFFIVISGYIIICFWR